MDRKLIIKRMLKSKFFMIGAIVGIFIIFLSILSPVIVKFNPIQNSLNDKLMAPEWFSKGLNGHIFGTDQMGRDVFTRLLLGSRYSLMIAFVVVIISSTLGAAIGIISGFYGKWIDIVIMRMCDVFLSIPNLILAIAIMAILGTSTVNLIVVLIATSWVQYCKITRNNVLVIKNMEFVKASKVLGASNWSIMFKQIFPNITTPLLILFSQSIGLTIMFEAALSFLNLGIQPPLPSWGNMIANGRSYLATCPWMIFAPGLALMLTVLAFNFLGDGLRDVLDPKRN